MAKTPLSQSKADAKSLPHANAVRLKASPGLVVLVVLLPALLVFGAGFVGYWIRQNHDKQASPTSTLVSGTDSKDNSVVHPSEPWGRLEAEPAFLQIPDEFLKHIRPVTPPRWTFRGYSKQRVLKLFTSVGLTTEALNSLADTNLWTIQPHQVVLQPPRQFILALSPAERGIIYSALAQFPENALQYAPFFWKTKDEGALLAQPVFSEPARTLIRQLSYQQENLSLFADWELLAELLPETDAELAKILKELSRKPAVIPRLHITPETDLNALMRYWGVGGLTKVMRPALEAVSRIPQGRTVTFLAVLPPFARERLNTYPESNTAIGQDGFWTAFNFFNDNPEPVSPDPRQWTSRLKSDYFNVFTDPRYGDIMVISHPGGEVVQAAVYLADDLVFTRVGATRWEPWVIMTTTELLEISSIRMAHQETPAVSYFRNRTF